MDKSLRERAKAKGKELLVESFQFSFSDVQLESFKEKTFVESNGRSYQAFAILKNVPVTKYSENLNGRVYPKRLWERIQKGQFAEGSLCLADHPENEGSTTRICGVWHNFKVLEKSSCADLYLIGPLGKLLLEVILAGGKCGMSTVGYGELEEDEQTVVWDTFELSERLADWVTDPSQEVFATQANIQKEQRESIQSTNTNKKDDVSIQRTEIPMDNTVLTKIQESNIKNQINGIKRRLKKEPEAVVEAVEQVKDLLEATPQDFAVRAKIEKFYEELTLKLDEFVEKREKEIEENQEATSKLQSKYDILKGVVEDLKEKNLKMAAVLENLGVSENSANPNMIESLESKIAGLSKNNELMKSDIDRFVENHKLMKRDIDLLVGERAEILKENAMLLKDRKLMESDIEKFKKVERSSKKKISVLESKMSELVDGDVIDPERRRQDADYDGSENPLENYASKGTLDGYSSNQVNQDYEDRYQKDYEDRYDALANHEKRGKAAVNQRHDAEYAPDPQFKSADEYQKKYLHPVDLGVLMPDGGKSSEEYGDDYEDSFEDGAYGSPYADYGSQGLSSASRVGESRKRTAKKLRQSLISYYENEVRRNPSIADIEDEILESSSLLEALKKVEHFTKRRKERPIKLTSGFRESIAKGSQGSWLGNRF